MLGLMGRVHLKNTTKLKNTTMGTLKRLFLLFCFITFMPSSVMAADVGVLWFGKSLMADRVVSGLRERLKEQKADITLEVKAALPDAEAFEAQFKLFNAQKDAIIALRSAGAREAKRIGATVPVLFGAACDPEQLGVVKDQGRPEGNLTGVTYDIAPHKILGSFLRVMPTLTSYLLLVEATHPAAVVNKESFEKTALRHGVTIKTVGVSSRESLKKAVEKHISSVDAVILGSQNFLQELGDVAVAAAGDKPVFSLSKTAVDMGALGGLIAEDKKLGKMLADSLIDILFNDKEIADLPVKRDPNPQLYLNIKTIDKLDVDLSPEVYKGAILVQ